MLNTLYIYIYRFNHWSSHTKDSKMVLDVSLLNTQHYRIWIKGKVGQFWERNSALPYTTEL